MELMSVVLICMVFSLYCDLIFYIFKLQPIEENKNDNNKMFDLNPFELLKRADIMSGTEFESFLQRLLEKLGYRVYTTPKSKDYGADLIVSKNGVRMVVQAKRYSKSVGIKAVQEALGAVQYYNASKAIVITNSKFTQDARKLADSNDVELWDRAILFELIVCARQLNDEVSYSQLSDCDVA